MPNASREMARFPSPSLSWGQNLASESIDSLKGSNKQLKSYLASQMITGNVAGSSAGKRLNKIAKSIILNTDTINSFFDKLSEFSSALKNPTAVKTTSAPKSSGSIPETRQFMDYSSGGEMQKTIVQNPINRSMDNAGNPQPIFPNKTF